MPQSGDFPLSFPHNRKCRSPLSPYQDQVSVQMVHSPQSDWFFLYDFPHLPAFLTQTPPFQHNWLVWPDNGLPWYFFWQRKQDVKYEFLSFFHLKLSMSVFSPEYHPSCEAFLHTLSLRSAPSWTPHRPKWHGSPSDSADLKVTGSKAVNQNSPLHSGSHCFHKSRWRSFLPDRYPHRMDTPPRKFLLCQCSR